LKIISHLILVVNYFMLKKRDNTDFFSTFCRNGWWSI